MRKNVLNSKAGYNRSGVARLVLRPEANEQKSKPDEDSNHQERKKLRQREKK